MRGEKPITNEHSIASTWATRGAEIMGRFQQMIDSQNAMYLEHHVLSVNLSNLHNRSATWNVRMNLFIVEVKSLVP